MREGALLGMRLLEYVLPRCSAELLTRREVCTGLQPLAGERHYLVIQVVKYYVLCFASWHLQLGISRCMPAIS